jgi:HlyD family secretion protein
MRARAIVALLALSLAGCFSADDGALQGYVEGTYVYISADNAGRVVERTAQAGTPVAEGAVLFKLDDADQIEAVAGAEARLAQAEAQLADLHSGKRPEEIAVLATELSSARTTFNAARDDYNRKLVLLDKGVVSQASVDAAKAAYDSAQSRVDAAERQLEVAKLPARSEEIAAAERNVAAQKAALAQAKIALERRTLRAPAAGLVEETFYEPGELVAAGQPVVSILPDANRKIRFFLPETELSRMKVGDRVAVACDNCPDGLEGEVNFVATDSEFTPPIIYSRENREKLVYRVEARPLGAAVLLKVGQPIDVTLLAPEAGS